jgi:hypothetical protein
MSGLGERQAAEGWKAPWPVRLGSNLCKFFVSGDRSTFRGTPSPGDGDIIGPFW